MWDNILHILVNVILIHIFILYSVLKTFEIYIETFTKWNVLFMK